MGNSPLVNYTRISPNKTSPRNHEIDTITIHCVVGQLSVERIGELFASSKAQASSNYGIGYDGRVGLYVEEKDRSWCSSNKSNDHRAITIEVASDTKHPYVINKAAYKTLIDLVADICSRNNIKSLKWKGDKSLIGNVSEQNMTVHRWFANKACPGDYIYNRLGVIADEVNMKLGAFKPYSVKVETDTLNIRTGPGTTFGKTGSYTGKGVFTIVEVQNGVGSMSGWGLLKSYSKNRNGWISLDYATKL